MEALVSHPNVNASYNAQTREMTYHEQVNLGIAVDTPAGLLSPVIHNAQDMSLPELAKAIVDIADRARNNKLKPQPGWWYLHHHQHRFRGRADRYSNPRAATGSDGWHRRDRSSPGRAL